MQKGYNGYVRISTWSDLGRLSTADRGSLDEDTTAFRDALQAFKMHVLRLLRTQLEKLSSGSFFSLYYPGQGQSPSETSVYQPITTNGRPEKINYLIGPTIITGTVLDIAGTKILVLQGGVNYCHFLAKVMLGDDMTITVLEIEGYIRQMSTGLQLVSDYGVMRQVKIVDRPLEYPEIGSDIPLALQDFLMSITSSNQPLLLSPTPDSSFIIHHPDEDSEYEISTGSLGEGGVVEAIPGHIVAQGLLIEVGGRRLAYVYLVVERTLLFAYMVLPFEGRAPLSVITFFEGERTEALAGLRRLTHFGKNGQLAIEATTMPLEAGLSA